MTINVSRNDGTIRVLGAERKPVGRANAPPMADRTSPSSRERGGSIDRGSAT